MLVEKIYIKKVTEGEVFGDLTQSGSAPRAAVHQESMLLSVFSKFSNL